MKQKQNLVIAIILSTAAGLLTQQNVFAPVPDSTTQTPNITITSTIEITDTPTYESCGYMWAYHDSPQLTEKINVAVRDINPNASARAELFGEDCVYADGHSTFGAMETDFHVRVPVDDLTNEDALGNWMAQVVPLVTEIPREEIQGSYGFVEFWFEKNDAEHVIVRVPIQRYMDEAQGKTGSELFRMFSVAP